MPVPYQSMCLSEIKWNFQISNGYMKNLSITACPMNADKAALWPSTASKCEPVVISIYCGIRSGIEEMVGIRVNFYLEHIGLILNTFRSSMKHV